jgi:hypothetical protein
MSQRTVRRESAEREDARPAAFLVDAMCAVLEGEPDRPILLARDVYARAGYLVAALAPETLERANAYVRRQVEPQSIRTDVLERIAPAS